MEKTDCCSLHECSEDLFLVDLVANVVDVGGELVLGVVVDNVTDVREDQELKYAVLQVFQEPLESDSKGFAKNLQKNVCYLVVQESKKSNQTKNIKCFIWHMA